MSLEFFWSDGVYFHFIHWLLRYCNVSVCNPNEGDVISLENFERSLQQIGGYTSSRDYLDSSRHKLPWI